MTKADLVEEIVRRTGLPKKDVARTVDEFLEAIKKALRAQKRVEIRGFGTFKVKKREKRIARNPKRPEQTVEVPERLVPVFKVSKQLREKVTMEGRAAASGSEATAGSAPADQ